MKYIYNTSQSCRNQLTSTRHKELYIYTFSIYQCIIHVLVALSICLHNFGFVLAVCFCRSSPLHCEELANGARRYHVAVWQARAHKSRQWASADRAYSHVIRLRGANRVSVVARIVAKRQLLAAPPKRRLQQQPSDTSTASTGATDDTCPWSTPTTVAPDGDIASSGPH